MGQHQFNIPCYTNNAVPDNPQRMPHNFNAQIQHDMFITESMSQRMIISTKDIYVAMWLSKVHAQNKFQDGDAED